MGRMPKTRHEESLCECSGENYLFFVVMYFFVSEIRPKITNLIYLFLHYLAPPLPLCGKNQLYVSVALFQARMKLIFAALPADGRVSLAAACCAFNFAILML